MGRRQTRANDMSIARRFALTCIASFDVILSGWALRIKMRAGASSGEDNANIDAAALTADSLH